ncbi:bifunctional MaoC family dehydratase N-terminal/OB-fold nucleic acid binding domain-containing protein [Nonomuraea cavernae]|uniref:DNA-binding protein n=1 Tax=Nonomuraea cavernae TaxID=2045107 RepID=A0A917Z1S3_9ACTN|nr:MaoC family dehydratase N-terminal domain-containing protein [Nonomuraea cavernae]MCA2188080.1 MaoC family dehydratase N-terminal domain-containing protein [Nonomuraea cavernae]GGO72735.1 DNA-binding protein [Nonomuraea cavernae]
MSAPQPVSDDRGTPGAVAGGGSASGAVADGGSAFEQVADDVSPSGPVAVDGYEERLLAFTGREIVPPRPGPDPVNAPMIRHWAEAMGDGNPVYQDEEAARASGRPGIVAPASMTQAWTMRGYAATVAGRSGGPGSEELAALLGEGGYTSVVATDSEFEFHRELVPGDHVSVREVVESISPEKVTALGPGRFVTTVRTYTDQNGETVAVQRWRTLRFRPQRRPTPPSPADTPETPPEALRPRPAVNRDNAFWFEAAREHRLVIQRCAACQALRHPPGPCCPECGSFDWDTVEASGRGHVHSFVVSHHPRHPAFEYPLVVAVVELAEGTRLITNLAGVTPDEVEIDLPVTLDWLDADPGLSLPVFRPVAQEDHH